MSAAAEANGDGVGSRARLQLRQQVPDMRLHGFLREEEPVADLAVRESVRDELKHLDLTRGRLLLELAERSGERDDLGVARSRVGPRPPRNDASDPCTGTESLCALQRPRRPVSAWRGRPL